MEWNGIAVPGDGCFRDAWRFLEAFAQVGKTNYLNVLAMRFDLPVRELLDEIERVMKDDPGAQGLIARLAPCENVFTFTDPPDFDVRAKEAVLARADSIVGRSFHVRVHRRGFKKDFDRLAREKRLGEALWHEAVARGTPSKIAYDDAEVVVAIETVDGRGGLSVWTRDDLTKYPLLRPD
jgi:hypothetical protein